MSLMIRPVVPEDDAFLYQLAYDNFYEQLSAWAWEPHTRETLLRIQVMGQRSSYAAQYPNAQHGIIMLYDSPVGRLMMDRGQEIDTLVDITIVKAKRGKGVGTWILRALCTEADLTRKRIRLHVQVTNRAQKLYERLGFHTIQSDEVVLLMERLPSGGGIVT